MLYNTLRYLLWIIISIIIVLKIRKTKIARKKLIALFLIILCGITIGISDWYPVENLFINFKSPESVFHYTCTGKIEGIINGDESCLVYYATGVSTYSQTFIIKSERGYKIAGYHATKKIFHKFDQDGDFDVYNVLGTNDYYVFGSVYPNVNKIEVFNGADELVGSDFKRIGNSHFIYLFIKNFTNQHYLIIDGKKKVLSK